MAEKFKQVLGKLLLSDILTFSYCIFQIFYVLILGFNLENRFHIISVYLSCIAAGIILILIRQRVHIKPIRWVALLYPLALLIAFYDVSGYQVHMFFDNFFDSFIIVTEKAVFGVHPNIWMQKFNHPWLTEWMMFGYSFYLFLIPITSGWLYCAHRPKEWQHLTNALLLSSFAGYIIFSLFPVAGPRLMMADQYTTAQTGYIFRAFTRWLESSAMLNGGAFPSVHCSAATVMIILSYKYDKKLFFWTAPIIITLYISTMYGRFHYPTDVVAGVIIGLISVYVYPPLKKFWERQVGTQEDIVKPNNGCNVS